MHAHFKSPVVWSIFIIFPTYLVGYNEIINVHAVLVNIFSDFF